MCSPSFVVFHKMLCSCVRLACRRSYVSWKVLDRGCIEVGNARHQNKWYAATSYERKERGRKTERREKRRERMRRKRRKVRERTISRKKFRHFDGMSPLILRSEWCAVGQTLGKDERQFRRKSRIESKEVTAVPNWWR